MISLLSKGTDMEIIIDTQEHSLTSVTTDGVIYAPSVTEINLVAQNGDQTDFSGLSVALLTTDGQTLAHVIASKNKAILDTNTIEAVAFVSGYTVNTEKMAFLAIGESAKPLAIIAVNVSPNPLADIAPPSALAPTYPTSESLRAILSQMTAQAQRAEDAVKATEKAQKAVAQYVDITFPAKVTEAEKRLENATTEGKSAVTQTANQAISALDNKQTEILGNIDTKANEVSTALDGKVTEANDAKDNAVKAKGEAETAKGQAEGFAKDASTSASNASKSAKQAEQAKTAIGDVSGRLEAVEALKSLDNQCPYTDIDFADLLKTATKQKVDGIAWVHTLPSGDIAVCGVWYYGQRRYVVVFDSSLTTVKAMLDTFAEKASVWRGYLQIIDVGSRTYMFGGFRKTASNVTFREIITDEKTGAVTFGEDWIPTGLGTPEEVTNGNAVFAYDTIDQCISDGVRFGRYIIFNRFVVDTDAKKLEIVMPNRLAWASECLASDSLKNIIVSITKNNASGRMCHLDLDDSGTATFTEYATTNTDKGLALSLGAVGGCHVAISPVMQRIGALTDYSTGLLAYSNSAYIRSIVRSNNNDRPTREIVASPRYLPAVSVLDRDETGAFGVTRFLKDARNYTGDTAPSVRKMLTLPSESSKNGLAYILGADSRGVWIGICNFDGAYLYYRTTTVRFVKWEDIKL
jgi:hypothetical protein